MIIISPRFTVALSCIIMIGIQPVMGEGLSSLSPNQQYGRAVELSKAGHWAEAQHILARLCSQPDATAPMYTALGRCYVKLWDVTPNGLERAEAMFRKAISLDKTYSPAYARMAEIANIKAKYNETLDWANKALSMPNPSSEGLRERMVAYSNLHKDKEALQDIKAYIATGHHDYKDLLNKANIEENLGRYEDAIKTFKETLKNYYRDSLVLRMAHCQEKVGRPQDAIASLTDLISKNARDEEAYQHRARIYVKIKAFDKAIADYTEALDILPNSSLYRERAAVYKAIGKLDLAKRDLAHAERDY